MKTAPCSASALEPGRVERQVAREVVGPHLVDGDDEHEARRGGREREASPRRAGGVGAAPRRGDDGARRRGEAARATARVAARARIARRGGSASWSRRSFEDGVPPARAPNLLRPGRPQAEREAGARARATASSYSGPATRADSRSETGSTVATGSHATGAPVSRVHEPARLDGRGRLGERHPLEGLGHGPQARLVLGLQRAARGGGSALRRGSARPRTNTPSRPCVSHDDHEPAHEVAQEAEAGVLLAGQAGPRGRRTARGGSAGAASRRRSRPCPAPRCGCVSARSSTSSSRDPGPVLPDDAQRAAGHVAAVELDPQRPEALGPQLGQDAGPLEQQLDPVAREVAEEARGSARGPGMSAREVVLGEREGEPVVDSSPRTGCRGRGAGSARRASCLLRDRLDLAAGGEPQADSARCTARRGGRSRRPAPRPAARPRPSPRASCVTRRSRSRRAPAESLQLPIGSSNGGVGAGDVHDEARAHRLEDGRQRLAQRVEVDSASVTPAPRAIDVEASASVGPQWSLWIEKRVHGRVVGEDLPRAVAVVQVEVHDEHRLREAPRRAAGGSPTATSLKMQKPRPAAAQAWWNPPPRWTATPPVRRASRVAWIVPARHQALEVERRPRRRAAGTSTPEDAGERLGLLQRLQVLGSVHEEQVLERHRPRLGESARGARRPGLVERAEDLVSAQGVDGDAADVPLVARVVDDRQAAGAQLVSRAAGDAGERAKRAAGHRRHCPTVAAAPRVRGPSRAGRRRGPQ